jgi:hypothetical protein
MFGEIEDGLLARGANRQGRLIADSLPVDASFHVCSGNASFLSQLSGSRDEDVRTNLNLKLSKSIGGPLVSDHIALAEISLALCVRW